MFALTQTTPLTYQVHSSIWYVALISKREREICLLRPLAAQSIGLSASQGALYSALFNVASAFGRLAFGYLGDVALGVGPVLLVRDRR